MSGYLPTGPAVSAAGRFLHWGVIQISLTNLLIIMAMIVVFVAALLIPFPGSRDNGEDRDSDD